MTSQASKERSLPALLRAAERRVNAHCFTGDKQTFASIPANRDRDLDLLLCEAADEIERPRAEAPRAALALRAWDFLCQLDICEPTLSLNEGIRRAYARVPEFQGETGSPQT